MNRFFKSFIACICLLVLFVQVGWAADEYTLTLNTQPSNAGSLNRSSGQTFAAGASVYMYCYANTDYVFDYWMSGDTIVSRDRYFYFTMPDHDATLTAVFRFDPNSPGNPDSPDQTKKYTLTLNTQPANAGSFNRSSGEQFKAGESIYMYEYNNDGFKFEKWISADTVVSTNRNFNFVMPAHDAELTAVYSYNPSSPANPDTAQVYYNVTLETQPVNAGTFSWNSTTKAVARSSCEVYAYPNTDFSFKEWQMNGETVGTDRRYRFQMPAENIRLVAVYDYTPANPSNPNKNYWNAETGEVIVDDFTAGNLSSAVNNTIGGSNNRDKVQMITVAGPVSQYDWGVVNNYSNCTYLDMSRTYGLTYVPSYNFSDNKSLTTVILPAGIERIEYYAFRNCSNLSSISIYAATPPTIGNRAFEGIGDSIVYVPADALALYQEAEGWKDFTILPLAKEVSALEINLPEGTDPSIYKDMYIELINTKSGQKQRYVITNRTTYTFNSLIHRTSYNVYLKNAQGDVLGEIDGIDIVDHDVSMTFESLKVPRDLTLKVLTPAGEDVTSQTTITWMDAKDTYLTKGNTLTGQMEGAYAKFHITLPQTLGMQYLLPKDSVYEVLAENDISITLKAIPQTTITGKVTDIKTGQPLSGATVAISQMLNGLYSKSFTTKTDNKGEWSQTVYEAKTDVTASMSDYVSKTQSFETPVTEVPAFQLKDISGTTISLNLTYTTTGGETQEYYTDYANVAYTVYNETTQQQITELNVQYPQIVLMDQLPEGTQLSITATSKNSKFIPVTAIATVDSLDRANVTLPIVQLGGITATFKQTDNLSVVGVLYDKNGYLIKKYDYPSATLTISELQDGDYTLVTMANSQFFNSVATVSQFAEAGLREGIDYVKNSVTVKSGAYTAIDNQLIPYLDESKLYYTGDGTSVTVNKSQITTGNYLTITGHIDFKPSYADQVSDVKLIVNLPEASAFVDNSVMRGGQTASYTYADNQVVVPLDYYGERVRFCFIPTIGGDFAATASVQFTLGDKTITQPIGNANFTVKNLSIQVPSTVAKTVVPVSGTAVGKSTVEIFDNGSFVGQTTALANGAWATTVELDNPYNLSTHSIYAKITTKDGVEMQSETKDLTYDMNAIQIQKVTMYHYNPEMHKTFESEFDFQNPHTTPNQWTVYYPNKKFTYTVDFTNNSPEKVSNVILYVHTADGQVVPLYPTYDEKKDIWVADIDMGNRSDGYYPVNVSIDYDVQTEPLLDRREIDDEFASWHEVFDNSDSERNAEIEAYWHKEDDADCLRLDSILSQDSVDINTVSALLDSMIEPTENHDTLTFEEVTNLYNQWIEHHEQWENTDAKTYLQMMLDDYYLDPSYDINKDFSYVLEQEGSSKVCSQKLLSSVDTVELSKSGYSLYKLNDGSSIYYYYSDELIDFIDVKNLKQYTIKINEVTDSIASEARRVSNSVAGYAQCMSSAIFGIKHLYENVKNARGASARDISRMLLSGIGDVLNNVSCYYDGFTRALRKSIVDRYEDAARVFNIEKQNATNLKTSIEGSMVAYKNEAADFERRWYELKGYINNHPELNENQLKAYNEQLDFLYDSRQKALSNLAKENKQWSKVKSEIANIDLKLSRATGKKNNLISIIDKHLPLTLKKGIKFPKSIRFAGKLAGEIGIPLQVACAFLDGWELYDNIQAWIKVMDAIDAKIPCEAQPERAQSLRDEIYSSGKNHIIGGCSVIVGEIVAIGVSTVGAVPLSPTWWVEQAINVICEAGKAYNSSSSEGRRRKLYADVRALKCKKDPCDGKPCPDGGGGGSGGPGGNGGSGGNGGGGGTGSGSSNDGVKIDPSGYVYEGVASNRLQGVTATAYYKEMVEDMYGDLHENVVLWNAEEYAQENPLFTDEYGMYQWDVPQGLWQVKFEKEGYQTTYSEWLPVPPPQLEVNIPMTQMLQPTVKSGKAYSEGVEMEFDKYMDPETLNTDNIMVTKNGNAVSGTVELLNEEVAYEGKTETFASKVRFNVPEGEELLSTDEVQLTVKKAVKSYAGVQMQDDYVQKFDVEPRVRLMAVDSLINVGYGAERTITVAALPADASKGKKVNVKSLSTMIASVDNEELTLDENGQAELKVSGELPGSTVLNYKMEDSDVEGLTTVNVKDAALLVTIAPRASRVSGTEVYRGTKVQLSSETDGAVIYYTLDGSCPCNTETAIKYDADAPIVINDDSVTIKAMAQGHDLAESDVVEFNYSLKTTTLGYTLPAGWTWISHNEETAVPVTEFQTGAERIVSQTQELINDPVAGFIGSLTELQPVVGYKVKQATEGNVRLSGYEWDATKQAVAVETGWNWIGYPVNQIMTVAEALAFFTPSEGDYLVGQNGFVEYADGEWKGTLEGMKPGEGFLYKSGAATEIPFNTTIVSTAGNRAFKRSVLVGSPWAANSRTYPNIMPMTAQLYDNGIRTSDGEYIVGAFVGTECRGVGQWKDDRLMMNINGTGGEELSFMAYNPQTEQMFNINETFKFTADNQGSWHQPCMLTIGSEATGISVSNLSGDFTVTPLVARDHITVTAGGNDINYLTLTDMSGRIVTSLRDLGTGATVTISTLPEGVYIVTAQAGGQTHYRKIVKSKN